MANTICHIVLYILVNLELWEELQERFLPQLWGFISLHGNGINMLLDNILKIVSNAKSNGVPLNESTYSVICGTVEREINSIVKRNQFELTGKVGTIIYLGCVIQLPEITNKPDIYKNEYECVKSWSKFNQLLYYLWPIKINLSPITWNIVMDLGYWSLSLNQINRSRDILLFPDIFGNIGQYLINLLKIIGEYIQQDNSLSKVQNFLKDKQIDTNQLIYDNMGLNHDLDVENSKICDQSYFNSFFQNVVDQTTDYQSDNIEQAIIIINKMVIYKDLLKSLNTLLYDDEMKLVILNTLLINVDFTNKFMLPYQDDPVIVNSVENFMISLLFINSKILIVILFNTIRSIGEQLIRQKYCQYLIKQIISPILLERNNIKLPNFDFFSITVSLLIFLIENNFNFELISTELQLELLNTIWGQSDYYRIANNIILKFISSHDVLLAILFELHSNNSNWIIPKVIAMMKIDKFDQAIELLVSQSLFYDLVPILLIWKQVLSTDKKFLFITAIANLYISINQGISYMWLIFNHLIDNLELFQEIVDWILGLIEDLNIGSTLLTAYRIILCLLHNINIIKGFNLTKLDIVDYIKLSLKFNHDKTHEPLILDLFPELLAESVDEIVADIDVVNKFTNKKGPVKVIYLGDYISDKFIRSVFSQNGRTLLDASINLPLNRISPLQEDDHLKNSQYHEWNCYQTLEHGDFQVVKFIIIG